MKVRVKLYGTLGAHVPGYAHAEGIDVEIPDGGRAKDLLSALNIPEVVGAMVAVEGRMLTPEDLVREGACVNVLQPISGG